jgi:cytosine/uracil/thiamine/allantoin permease
VIQITEYWLVRKGHYRVMDLYSDKKDGWYYYSFGVNWRFVPPRGPVELVILTHDFLGRMSHIYQAL